MHFVEVSGTSARCPSPSTESWEVLNGTVENISSIFVFLRQELRARPATGNTYTFPSLCIGISSLITAGQRAGFTSHFDRNNRGNEVVKDHGTRTHRRVLFSKQQSTQVMGLGTESRTYRSRICSLPVIPSTTT